MNLHPPTDSQGYPVTARQLELEDRISGNLFSMLLTLRDTSTTRAFDLMDFSTRCALSIVYENGRMALALLDKKAAKHFKKWGEA